jgi:tRNA-2-methylthio-N6-dimethylallyladenosine synthase
LQEIVDLQGKLSHASNLKDIGKTVTVLIESNSKRNDQNWMGRSSQNKVVVFPKNERLLKPGDYVKVRITNCTQATLLGEIV